jgi:SAM-dependent methyltransferase
MKNRHYKTDEILNYFSTNRVRWDQFYPSERKLLESIGLSSERTALDIGCGCGGLGLALNEKFGISSYTGVDINSAAITKGRELNSSATLIAGDILDETDALLNGQSFDLVCSLSCIDWNVQFSEMLLAAWRHVKPGGKFVATFRLCLGKGSSELKDSYQYINYEGKKEGEIAAYVVLNFKKLMAELEEFNPSEIKGTGYWGMPSSTAVTPYDSLCFAAFSITKREEADFSDVCIHLDLPEDITAVLED